MKVRILYLTICLGIISSSFCEETTKSMTVTVSDGADFCIKLLNLIDQLNRVTTLDVTLPTCQTTRNGFWNDDAHLTLSFEPLTCTKNGPYTLRQLTYEGIYYIDTIKQVTQLLQLRFISQTSDDTILSQANGGDFILSVGIPHCQPTSGGQ